MTARICHAGLTVCLLFSLICLLERRAYAYVDPGSGLLAFQTLSAFLTGIFFYFRQRLRRAIGSLRTHHNSERPSL
jgi:hypothetical protein